MRSICCCFIHHNLDRYPKLFRRNCLDETVNTATTQITTIANDVYSTYLKGSYDKFHEKYESVKENAKQTFTKDNAKKIPNKYKEWGKAAYGFAKSKFSSSEETDKKDQSGGGIRDTLEEVNYYVFQYATIVIQVLKQTHAIITDTLANVVKDQSGKSTADLISAQKIKTLAQSEDTKAMIGSLLGIYGTFKTYIEQLEGRHIHDAIKIIFSPDESQMIAGIKQLKTNIEGLTGKTTNDIKNVDDFVKQLLLGSEPNKKIQKGASDAKSLIEKQEIKTLLEGIEEVKDVLEQLTGILDTMSKSGTETSESS